MMQVFDALIVDDEVDIQQVCSMYLENMGCFRNIIVASDGVDATVKLSNQTFGLILLDINLPKKNGLKILGQMRDMQNNQLSKVIIVSGELNKDVLADAMSFGVNRFLVKPFDEARFRETIMSVIKCK